MSDGTATYPNRPSHYAHRFVRLMFRTHAASEIGSDAVVVLTNIVHTEDAKFYSGPVRFFAGNLADQCGFSVSSMERARAKAVKAGWLHYEAGAKNRMATYWVTIPERFKNVPDGPTDDGILRQPDGAFDGASDVESADDAILRQPDGASGEHLTAHLKDLQPYTPCPKEEAASPPARKSAKKTKPKTATKRKQLPSLNRGHTEVVKHWAELWESKYGKKFTWLKRHFAMVSWLTENSPDVAAVKVTIERYLSDADPWLIREEHPLGVLQSKFNRYKPADRPTTGAVAGKTMTSKDLDPDIYGPVAGGGR